MHAPEQSVPQQSIGPRRILVRGVNWLGDAVMSTPALLRLREAFPDADIALSTPEKLQDLWGGHPAVDEVIPLSPGESIVARARRLRESRFDVALVLPNSPRSAIECWLAGIPRRVGYARRWRRWFLTDPVPDRAGHAVMTKRRPAEIRRLVESTAVGARPGAGGGGSSAAHQSLEYLHLAAVLGCSPAPREPELAVSGEEIAAARRKFDLDRWSGLVLAVNPGAEYGPAKRWPPSRFAQVIGEIAARTDCLWLLLGGPRDVEIANAVMLRVPESGRSIRNLAGKTSLRELCALLKSCRVLLTNDTGPMHVAAALGTPVVALFGSTSPALTGPGLPGDPRHRLLSADAPCSPCYLRECPIDFRCMMNIGTNRVAEAVNRILALKHPA